MMQESAGRHRPLWQHAVFYSWLLLASIGPLADEAQSGRPLWIPLAVVGLLALWYAAWLIVRIDSADRPPAVYVAGAALLWLVLLAVDSSFVLVGLNVFAPYCLHSRRVGLPLAALCAGGWLWQRAEATGSISWPEVVVALLIAIAGAATVGYVSTLARVSTERRRLIDQLEASRAAQAAAEHAAGVAAERQRLARDIHDTLTQGFASIVMLLEAAEALAVQGRPTSRHVGQALRVARDNLAESRRVVWALRPAELGEGELDAALRQLAARLEDETGVRSDTVVTGAPSTLSPDAQTTLLRVAQEALSNVRRHAHANHVDVTLSYLDDLVALDVQDDGRGFDVGQLDRPGEQLTGLGLSTMRERVHELGGAVAVESSPGAGTTVAVTLPVRPGTAAARSSDGSAIDASVGEP